MLDLSGVFDLEYSALKMLTEAEQRQREAGVKLWLAGLTPDVYAVIRRSPWARRSAASAWCSISRSPSTGIWNCTRRQEQSHDVSSSKDAGTIQVLLDRLNNAAPAARAGAQGAKSIAASDWATTTCNS